MELSVPRDRDGSFEPKIVRKRQKRLTPQQPPTRERKRRRLPLVLLVPVVRDHDDGRVSLPVARTAEATPPDGGSSASGSADGSEHPGSGPSQSASASADDSQDEEREPGPSQSPSDGQDGEDGQDGQDGADQSTGGRGGDQGENAGSGGGGGSASGGGGGGGASGGSGGDDDPTPTPQDPGPPSGCGGDHWGPITSVADGLRVGLATSAPEEGAAVIMGGTTDYGWVRSDGGRGSAETMTSFFSCSPNRLGMGPDSSGTGTTVAVSLSGFAYATWELDDSAPSDAYYMRTRQGCLTNNGEGVQLTTTTCIPGNEDQMWRIPE